VCSSDLSLIAKGCAQLLGFRLVWNFSFPYWAVSIQDFWRRWHISLSTWLRDYLYIPLGGSRKGPGRTYLNLMLTMILGGLWHGAAWNFVAWGFLHGAALCLHRLWENNARGLRLPGPLAWLLTQCFVMVGWFFFRVGSLRRAWDLVTSLGSWRWQPVYESYLATLALVLLPAMALELWQMRAQDPLVPAKLGLARYSLLSAALILLVFAKFRVTSYAFIYFQF
jgi:D-alanyl-lipoteichoic acid acyltransferase DltB (MBOAT superfamily)